MIGKTILHYRILEKLGEGGMGVVYKAQDTKLDRTVAIKFLPRQLATVIEETKRFEREARAAAALNHPNIATIYAIEELEDERGGKECFIVMEYIDGQELREKIKTSPPSIEETIQITYQIAEGLQVLHKQKIVRRELSPEFITLRADDQSVLLTDLELAKILDGSPPTPVDWESNPYVAPELFGDQVDVRSDLFSWGQVLYHAATGDAPPKLPTRGLFDAVNVPDFVKSTAVKCVSKGPSGRPNSLQQVLKTARRWEKMARRITDE